MGNTITAKPKSSGRSMTHSPLPWTTLHPGSVWDANGHHVCNCRNGDGTEGNAALIVTAVNAHERMRKALESLAKVLEKVQADLKWIALTHNLPEPTLAALGEVIATICDPELAALGE